MLSLPYKPPELYRLESEEAFYISGFSKKNV